MIVAKRNDHTITRNTSFFKPVQANNSREKEIREDDSDDDFELLSSANDTVNNSDDEDVSEEHALRRSTRVTSAPVRYPMGVQT